MLNEDASRCGGSIVAQSKTPLKDLLNLLLSSYYPHVQIPLRSFELKLVKYVEFNQKYDIDQNKDVSVFAQQVCKSGLNRKFCKDLK